MTQPSNTVSIDDIIDGLERGINDVNYCPGGHSIDAYEKLVAKQQITQLVSEIIGENYTCEKGHAEYFDWCSYCGFELTRNELRGEQVKAALERGIVCE